jgi:hypothetical protein
VGGILSWQALALAELAVAHLKTGGLHVFIRILRSEAQVRVRGQSCGDQAHGDRPIASVFAIYFAR